MDFSIQDDELEPMIGGLGSGTALPVPEQQSGHAVQGHLSLVADEEEVSELHECRNCEASVFCQAAVHFV